jgi:hypothetical protein
VAPSLAGLALAVAAVLAFLVRTPLRLVLIGLRRHRHGDAPMSPGRERLARQLALVELALLGLALLLAVWLTAEPTWWLPGLAALPLLALTLWHDMRSRSRDLVPEVAGALAFASVASMGALAGGASWPLALGLWLIVGARVGTSIPHVRAQVARLHGRRVDGRAVDVGDAVALLLAGAAALVEPALLLGTGAVVALVIVGRVAIARPPIPAKTLGLRQMALGFGLVGATALGVWLV